jgi:DNA primase
MLPHINLFYEGIIPQTAELFKICYDPRLDRYLFPHFNYDNKNTIVGITGRTTRSTEEIEQLLLPKYWNYISGYKKMYNLYGFSHSLEYAIKNKKFIIFEAEKSVLKQYTMTRNEGFSCAVGGHEISLIQAQIIMRYLPPDVEVIIAFDKDVMMMKDKKTGEHVGEQFLLRQASLFSKYRKTSYIFDNENLLDDFDSPIDKGYHVFHQLLDNRREI